jgi:hypothetical protein
MKSPDVRKWPVTTDTALEPNVGFRDEYTPTRRFPPPWSVDELAACFSVRQMSR